MSSSVQASSGRDRAALLGGVVVWLLLVSGKAFNVDEPLFVWLAQQIAVEPLDFFGFDVNWYGSAQPMYAVTRNPPLAGYALAAVGSLFGWSERALHVAFIVPAAVVALTTHALAGRWCTRPLLATVLALATPAFLVSATGVMSDVPMLALWCLALWAWLRGVDRSSQGWLWGAALLLSAALLTKYFAIALVPLLLLHGLARERRLGTWALPLLLPLVVLLGFEAWMLRAYGAGALAQAASEALHLEGIQRPGLRRQVFEGLAFAGGCLAPALLFAPWLWGRRVAALGALALALAVALAPASLGWCGLPVASNAATGWFGFERVFALQFFAMVLGGFSLLALALRELRRRDADSLLLAAWILGTFVFAAFVNWTNNGRSILPIAPVLGIAIVRGLDARDVGVSLRARGRLALGAVCAALALSVSWADVRWSNAVRDSAAEVAAAVGTADAGRAFWFHGHWGWQFYLEAEGGRAIDWRRDRLEAGDWLAVPLNNAEAHHPAPDAARRVQVLRFASPAWVRTQARAAGASFHASNLGPAPYLFGALPPDEVRLYRVLRPIVFERWFSWSRREAAGSAEH